jgi:hypothetical protein
MAKINCNNNRFIQNTKAPGANLPGAFFSVMLLLVIGLPYGVTNNDCES